MNAEIIVRLERSLMADRPLTDAEQAYTREGLQAAVETLSALVANTELLDQLLKEPPMRRDPSDK